MGSSKSKPSPPPAPQRTLICNDLHDWLPRSRTYDDWLLGTRTSDARLSRTHIFNESNDSDNDLAIYSLGFSNHQSQYNSNVLPTSSSRASYRNISSAPIIQPQATPFASTRVKNTIPRQTFVPAITIAPTAIVTNNSQPDKPISQCSRGSQICMHSLRGTCSYGLECRFIHSNASYLWAYWSQSNKTWYKFDNQELLEKSYCDPSSDTSRVTINQNGCSSSLDITFNDNIKDPFSAQNFEIRRFCTPSNGQCNDVMATQWLWYCYIVNECSNSIWKEYSTDTDCSSSSIDFEKAFLNPEQEFIFAIGSGVYNVIFDSLMQVNIDTQFSRKMRRRPKYLSVSDIQELKKAPRQEQPRRRNWKSTNSKEISANSNGQSRNGKGPANVMRPFRNCPKHWESTGEDKENYLHSIVCKFSNWEFRRVVNAMRLSMPRVFVKSLYRVENKKLHELFFLKRRQMMEELTAENLNEQFLFHGCPAASIDAICHQGFDFRLSGERVGSIYGRGVYFALEASYSNNYCEQSSPRHKKMFIAKVLVGRYTVGSAEYKRPPAINNSHILYDSCVNDVSNPTIFAIFDSGQVYPEYLVEYRYI